MPIAGNQAAIQFSFDAESAYGTPIADGSILQRIQTSEPPMPEDEVIGRSNEGAAGLDFPTVEVPDAINATIPLAYETTGGFKIALWAAAFCMGKVTTIGASDPFTHTVEFQNRGVVGGLDMSSTSVLYNLLTATLKQKYQGVIIPDFNVEQAVGDVAAKFGFSLMTDGSVAVSSFTPAATEQEDALLIRDNLTTLFGPTGSPVDVSARCLSARFEVDTNYLADRARVSGDGLFKSRAVIGFERTAQMILTLERDPTDPDINRNRHRDKDVLEGIMNWNTGGSPNRRAQYRLPACRIVGWTASVDGGIAQEEITLAGLDNGTDPFAECIFDNAVASVL